MATASSQKRSFVGRLSSSDWCSTSRATLPRSTRSLSRLISTARAALTTGSSRSSCIARVGTLLHRRRPCPRATASNCAKAARRVASKLVASRRSSGRTPSLTLPLMCHSTSSCASYSSGTQQSSSTSSSRGTPTMTGASPRASSAVRLRPSVWAASTPMQSTHSLTLLTATTPEASPSRSLTVYSDSPPPPHPLSQGPSRRPILGRLHAHARIRLGD